MAAIRKLLTSGIWKNICGLNTIAKECRASSTVASAQTPLDNQTRTTSTSTKENKSKNENSRGGSKLAPERYRFVYPEFLPDPNPRMRNTLREKFERSDMMGRRSIIDIPEFYVGSILGVNYTEPHAPGKKNRFVGICIQRQGCGLRAEFTLRNVIDHQGIDVRFFMYDPSILAIECLRLEKRLDDELIYLRDCPNEYSTFPVDMEMELLPEGSPVPINTTVVPLKPRPWMFKWEQKGYKGLSGDFTHFSRKRTAKIKKNEKPWEKYDLMKIYRETIPEEDQQAIYSEIFMKLDTLQQSRKKLHRKRGFVFPQKRG